MLSPLQAWSVGHMLLAAVVAAAASWALRSRAVSAHAQSAAVALRVFWAGLGGTAVVQTAMLLGAAAGVGAGFALATELLAYSTSAVALGALAAYFGFLFTGSRRAVPIIGALYAGVILLQVGSVVRSGPTGIELTRWAFEVTHVNEPGGVLAAVPALAALLPAIGGAIAFIVLGLRSTGATRRRGVLVGTALVLWFGSALAVSTGTVENDVAQVVRKLASMAGLAAIFLAYLAPRALQERWGLDGLGEEHAQAPPRVARAQPDPREPRMSDAMLARVRELI